MTGPLVIVAIGSNLGESNALVTRAISRIQQLSAEAVRKSSLWATTPVDCPPDSPPFINAVVMMSPLPGETPESLLAKLQGIEKEFGRKQKQVINEPRTLDLDLIAFGNEVRSMPHLVLPHPRAHQRRFVLQPLNEIAPDLILPGQHKTVAELLRNLPQQGRSCRLGPAS
ncbi:MAG: 2-amino-4-hydroxy-6-hydroxymethyldihydropteridine diphosphokinase [Verrucomicrobia bacterium]|nr:MAG: 2-amino-4-hydroxy-6-hydroxymethyldihydropteridine diphosphokinase [Verrucomicrobiota bacterium]